MCKKACHIQDKQFGVAKAICTPEAVTEVVFRKIWRRDL